MRICVIGTGYVGLVTATGFSDIGNHVIGADIDKKKIQALQQANPVIYEPGLEEMLARNIQEGRLEFTTDIPYAVKKSKIIFIAVGTPQSKDGSADVSIVLRVAKVIGMAMNNSKIVINKSTAPVGTGLLIEKTIKKYTSNKFDFVSNPEFLKEGAAIDDFLKPERVVLGSRSQKALNVMKELYAPFVRTGKPIICMDVKSAEMTKYAANAFLATRISFINEIANLCKHLGANIDLVRTGIGTDSRIGMQFLFPGLGYGGSCFPKDVKALIKMGQTHGHPMRILEAVDSVNSYQRQCMINMIKKHFKNNLRNKIFCIWGLSFKPRTNDIREAPSINIIRSFLRLGVRINAYDPVANEEAKKVLGNSIKYFTNQYDALNGASGLLITTECYEFRRPDFTNIKKLMKSPVIFDGRNIFDTEKMREMGFKYYSIGRDDV
ncbi:MAG TPA: UDP-glucose/GDP-mannose dehydrogenase family protein [bacterium]